MQPSGLAVRRLTVGSENSQEHIPQRLEELISSAPVEVRNAAVCLVSEFADVFAINYLVLGSFTDIEHRIDTGDARPLKQRMRRSPAVFQVEEEGH